jgi:hypothetical protein
MLCTSTIDRPACGVGVGTRWECKSSKVQGVEDIAMENVSSKIEGYELTSDELLKRMPKGAGGPSLRFCSMQGWGCISLAPSCFLSSCYLDWEAWEMVEMMRRLARTRSRMEYGVPPMMSSRIPGSGPTRPR